MTGHSHSMMCSVVQMTISYWSSIPLTASDGERMSSWLQIIVQSLFPYH